MNKENDIAESATPTRNNNTRNIIIIVALVILAGLIGRIIFGNSSASSRTVPTPRSIGTLWINGFEQCPTHPEYGDQVVNGANLWQEKNTSSSRLAFVLHGTKVDLLGEDGFWVKVRHGASTGYVQKILTSNYDPDEGIHPDEDSCL